MRKLLLFGVALALLAPAGCCRMCCWQRGGSFHNGYCYPAMPPLQPTPQVQPTQTYAAPYAQPCVCQ